VISSRPVACSTSLAKRRPLTFEAGEPEVGGRAPRFCRPPLARPAHRAGREAPAALDSELQAWGRRRVSGRPMSRITSAPVLLSGALSLVGRSPASPGARHRTAFPFKRAVTSSGSSPTSVSAPRIVPQGASRPDHGKEPGAVALRSSDTSTAGRESVRHRVEETLQREAGLVGHSRGAVTCQTTTPAMTKSGVSNNSRLPIDLWLSVYRVRPARPWLRFAGRPPHRCGSLIRSILIAVCNPRPAGVFSRQVDLREVVREIGRAEPLALVGALVATGPQLLRRAIRGR